MSLRIKFTLTFSLTLTLVILLTLFFYMKEQKKLAHDLMEKKVVSMAETFAMAVEMALNNSEFRKISELVNKAGEDKNISFIVVYDSNSDELARYREIPAGVADEVLLSKVGLLRLDGTLVVTVPVEVQEAEREALTSKVPYSFKEHRLLVIGYSLEGVEARLAEQAAQAGIIFVGILIIGIIIDLFFGHLLTRQIRQLTQATRDFSETGKETEINISSSDEIGELAESFQRMRSTIKTSMHDLNSTNEMLGREIEQRLEAEQKISQERQNFFNMLEHLPVLFHLHRSDYTVPFANKIFRERFGAPEGEKCYELLYQAKEPCENCPTARTFATGKPERSVFEAFDGKIYLSVNTPFSISDEEMLVMRMEVDITQEKTYESKQRFLVDELRRSNQDLQEFAVIAAHDLQEPLRKILFYNDLLIRKEANLSADGKNYIERIKRATARMQSFIDDLLKFSKVSWSAKELERVDLKEIVNGVIDDLETRIQETRATFILGDLPGIDADPSQMKQLFTNLIGNSLKFRQKEKPLTIKIDGFVDAHGNVKISIEDNGIGFDQSYADMIFKPFERLHAKKDFAGTGMGLAICRKIAARHQGRIEAISQPKRGTTIILNFPRTTLSTSSAA
ncbi:MAG: ATP-binding protein [Nitrospinaceae bacterium]